MSNEKRKFKDSEVPILRSEEKEKYNKKVKKAEEEIGQISQTARIRFALGSVNHIFTIDQIQNMTGAGRETVRRALVLEEIDNNVRHVGEIDNGQRGRNTSVYFYG